MWSRREHRISIATQSLVDEEEDVLVVDEYKLISVPFFGNSMLYFNDLPRFLQELSEVPVRQDSCLRGGTSITSIEHRGKGMDPNFDMKTAVLGAYHCKPLHDYGACTAKQLLLGYNPKVRVNDVNDLYEDGNSTRNRNPSGMDRAVRTNASGTSVVVQKYLHQR